LHDDRAEFEAAKLDKAARMAGDERLAADALAVNVAADRYDWSYQWSWLGLPIIQMPSDIVVLQEIIWSCRPDLVIETGVARGGSVIFSASMLELLGQGQVLGIDIDIRAHNRGAVESHPLSKRVSLLEGSSIDPEVVAEAAGRAKAAERVMVVLDSDHTHEHVLAELEAYAPLVCPGSYVVVFDTVVEYLPASDFADRPWHPGNSPKTAADEFLSRPDCRFVVDEEFDSKLAISVAPGGYLRCVR
jgi:cephalosporin hydroxylase